MSWPDTSPSLTPQLRRGPGSIVPDILGAKVSVIAPDVLLDYTIATNVIAGAFNQYAPAVLEGGEVLLVVALWRGHFSVNAVTVTGNSLVVPDVVAGKFTIKEPTVELGGGITVAPNVVAGKFSVLTPTPSAHVIVAPNVLEGAFSLPTSSVNISNSPRSGYLAGKFSVLTPTIKHDYTVSPSVIGGRFTPLAVTVATTGIAAPGYPDHTDHYTGTTLFWDNELINGSVGGSYMLRANLPGIIKTHGLLYPTGYTVLEEGKRYCLPHYYAVFHRKHTDESHPNYDDNDLREDD